MSIFGQSGVISRSNEGYAYILHHNLEQILKINIIYLQKFSIDFYQINNTDIS